MGADPLSSGVITSTESLLHQECLKKSKPYNTHFPFRRRAPNRRSRERCSSPDATEILLSGAAALSGAVCLSIAVSFDSLRLLRLRRRPSLRRLYT